MGPTVLVIGASGSMGSLVMKEFINHRSSFGRVGVLTDPAKESKFAQLKEQGFDVILGSYTDPASYEGKRRTHHASKSHMLISAQVSRWSYRSLEMRSWEISLQ